MTTTYWIDFPRSLSSGMENSTWVAAWTNQEMKGRIHPNKYWGVGVPHKQEYGHISWKLTLCKLCGSKLLPQNSCYSTTRTVAMPPTWFLIETHLHRHPPPFLMVLTEVGLNNAWAWKWHKIYCLVGHFGPQQFCWSAELHYTICLHLQVHTTHAYAHKANMASYYTCIIGCFFY